MLSSWLYDDSNPFVLLETNKVFEKLRKMIDTDYFEKLNHRIFYKKYSQISGNINTWKRIDWKERTAVKRFIGS